jgi:transcription-repair coupling factor (superfamily II helicase)
MYMQLLAEAVAELRGRPIEQPKELKLEVLVDVHLPAAYVPRERLRLGAYRRLGGARVVEEVESLAVGLTEVVCFGGRARLFPVDDFSESKQVRLDRLYPGTIWKQPERTLLVPLPPEGTNLRTWLCELVTGALGAPEGPALADLDRPERRRAAS